MLMTLLFFVVVVDACLVMDGVLEGTMLLVIGILLHPKHVHNNHLQRECHKRTKKECKS